MAPKDDEWTEEKVAEIYERMKDNPLLDLFEQMLNERWKNDDKLKDNPLMQTFKRLYGGRHG